MKVIYVLETSTAPFLLEHMLIPQIESGVHGADVVEMFFIGDNTYLLTKENHLGKKLDELAESGITVMGCDKCVYDRKIAKDLIDNAEIGCFPDLYKKAKETGADQVITL